MEREDEEAKWDAWLFSFSLCLQIVFPAKTKNFHQLFGGFSHNSENREWEERKALKPHKTGTEHWRRICSFCPASFCFLKSWDLREGDTCQCLCHPIKHCNFDHQLNYIQQEKRWEGGEIHLWETDTTDPISHDKLLVHMQGTPNCRHEPLCCRESPQEKVHYLL